MSLTLFTNITEELTDLEKGTLVPELLRLLQPTAKDATMKSKWLVQYMCSLGYQVTDVRIRKMVNYIRVTNAAKPKVLIGAGNGYFLTDDIITVEQQIESMQGRIDSMKGAIDAMRSQLLNLKHKQ